MYRFEYNKRLGIAIPNLYKNWESYDKTRQEEILSLWEEIRGDIPDRVKEIEQRINDKQALLFDEDDFIRSCAINSEISELASTINDLWIWFRSHGEITEKNHH